MDKNDTMDSRLNVINSHTKHPAGSLENPEDMPLSWKVDWLLRCQSIGSLLFLEDS